MEQITLGELNQMDESEFVAALAEVFELAPWVAEKRLQRPALCRAG